MGSRLLNAPLPTSLASLASVRRSASVKIIRCRPSRMRRARFSALRHSMRAAACRSSQHAMPADTIARKDPGLTSIMLPVAQSHLQCEFSNTAGGNVLVDRAPPPGCHFSSCTGVQSVGVKAQRERHCLGCLPHPSRSQSGNTIANVGFRHGLEIVEVCRTRFRHPVVRRQDDLCRDTANSGRDGCDGDRIEDGDGRIACEDQHGTLLVWCLEGVPADVSSIQGAPQSCSPNQRSNSFGATGLRA